MNYSHAFHAGNFADLVKHAVLLQLLDRLTGGPGPLTVIDTHAGAGLYDLDGAEARRSGEAQQGIARLLAAPAAPAGMAPLIRAVRTLNPDGGLRTYPGSPWLITQALRPADSYIGCELRPDVHAELRRALKGQSRSKILNADGYRVAMEQTPADGRLLLVVDPPFERPDDYVRSAETLADARRKNPSVQALVWLPLKDLETFDAFLRRLEDNVDATIQVAETRLRPLTDPMSLNGCALVMMGTPDLAAVAAEICGWVAGGFGAGGGARVYALDP